MTSESGQDAALDASALSSNSPLQYSITSSRPDLTRVHPDHILAPAGECRQRTIDIIGLNDGIVGGDAEYSIDFSDPQGNVVISVPGVHMENDQLTEFNVDLRGPASLALGESASYLVRFVNNGLSEATDQVIVLDASGGLRINEYIASDANSAAAGKGATQGGSIVITGVNIPPGNAFLISLDVTLVDDMADSTELSARILAADLQAESDNTLLTPIAVFRSSFEDE